jgi:hypothetical protein
LALSLNKEQAMALVRRAALGIALSLMLGTPAAAQTIFVMDATGDVGRHTSIAVDASSVAHMSYYDVTNTNLKYATRSSSTSSSSTVDNGASVGQFTSIALSTTPLLAFISYYDDGNQYLKLAHQESAGGPWTLQYLPATVRLMARSSLVLHPSNVTPIIAFFDVNDRNLKLALFDRAGTSSSPPLTYPDWGVEVVASAPTNVEDLALVLAPSGEPRIAYIEQSGTTAQLKYAHKSCLAAGCLTQTTAAQPTGEGTWTVETIPGAGLVQGSVALALDAGGNPLIAYYAGGELKYAFKSGSTWTIETVPDPAADEGRHVSIALSSTGTPHLAYYDVTNGDLKHAARTGGTWTVSQLDGASGDVGQYTAIALDATNRLHVSYYDVGNADLRYRGPSPPGANCCAACGAMAAVLLVPLVGAGYWRRRVRHEDDH